MSISCKSCTIADIRAAYRNAKCGSSTQNVFYKGLNIELTHYDYPGCKAHVEVTINPPRHVTCGFVAWSFQDVLDGLKHELAYWKYAGVI